MRLYCTILIVVLLSSCREEVKKEDLHSLTGYWEIEEVEFPSGDKKAYELSTTVDYIEIKDMAGYRKKVQPLPDGSFITSDDAEEFSIHQRSGSFYMSYKNDMSEWEEEIVTISSSRLVLRNQAQISYIYKRYQPLALN